MTKIYSTGKSPDVKTVACDGVTHDKQVDKNLQDYQNEIILLVDQGIGGVDIARGLLIQGENTDVLPRYYHIAYSGRFEQ